MHMSWSWGKGVWEGGGRGPFPTSHGDGALFRWGKGRMLCGRGGDLFSTTPSRTLSPSRAREAKLAISMLWLYKVHTPQTYTNTPTCVTCHLKRFFRFAAIHTLYTTVAQFCVLYFSGLFDYKESSIGIVLSKRATTSHQLIGSLVTVTWVDVHAYKCFVPDPACTFVVLFFFRRLGVDLGKSVVYQESNGGKIEQSFVLFFTGCKLLNVNCFYFSLFFFCSFTTNWKCCSLAETRVDVKESVRGQDIFIIQTIPRWATLSQLTSWPNGLESPMPMHLFCQRAPVFCFLKLRGHSILYLCFLLI